MSDFRAGLEATRRDLVLAALRRHRGNRARAAEDLGVSRAHLYILMRRFGITLQSQTPQGRAAQRRGS